MSDENNLSTTINTMTSWKCYHQYVQMPHNIVQVAVWHWNAYLQMQNSYVYRYKCWTWPTWVLNYFHPWYQSINCLFSSYVTAFAKRVYLGANLDFEFCIQHESRLMRFLLHFTVCLLASSVSEIRLLKVQNYEHSVFKKTVFKHLLPGNPAFCCVTNDVNVDYK